MSGSTKTPYSDAPPEAFWANCAADREFHRDLLWMSKFDILPETAIATAGSCFAQHIGAQLKESDAHFLDVEPAVKSLTGEPGKPFGYGLFSARYGNVYTARQLSDLAQDCRKGRLRKQAFWQRGDMWFDALRPTVEPDGLNSREEAKAHRLDHLARVKSLFQQTDILIFTLGLTEYWRDKRSGVAYPTCPGVVAGEFNPKTHEFRNATYEQVMADMKAAMRALRRLNPSMKFLLTVSPVPLSATATGGHVVPATAYSKSVLRAAAGRLAETYAYVDYFPSYEIITSAAFGPHFTGDGRQVSAAGVDMAMATFFRGCFLTAGAELSKPASVHDPRIEDGEDDVVCDEILMDALSK